MPFSHLPTLALITFAWWAVAIAFPAWLANRAFARGKNALAANAYEQAERWLKRAAERPDLKSKALCLIAQCALRSGRPHEAIFALDELSDPAPSSQALFLRGIACTTLRQGSAAQRALTSLMTQPSELSTQNSELRTSEHLLALLHAALVAGDLDSAESLLHRIPPEHFSGPLAARLQLCQAAFRWAQANYPAALAALPDESQCSPADRSLVAALRKTLQETK